MADMQRGKDTLNSFSQTVDMNQGTLFNDTSMDDSASWDNMPYPNGNQLFHYIRSQTNGSVSQANAANDHTQAYSCWDRGESSSNKSNMHSGTCVDDSKLRGTLNISSGSSSSERSCGTMSVSLNQSDLQEQDFHKDLGLNIPCPICQFNSSATGRSQSQYASSSNVGTSSVGLPDDCSLITLFGCTHGHFYASGGSNSSVGPNHVQQGRDQLSTPNGTSARRIDVNAAQSFRCFLNTASSELRPPTTPSHLTRVNEYSVSVDPHGGSSTSLGDRILGSFIAGGHDGGSVRSLRRINLQYPPALPVRETRNISPDQVDWSYDPGTSSASRSRVGHSSDGWSSHQNHQTYQNHQQLPESASWSPLPPPRIEFVSENQRPLPSSTTSVGDEVGSSSNLNQVPQSSAGIWIGTTNDDRQRVVRRYLLRRRNLHSPAEDETHLNPYIDDILDLHDRHRDMRLDVDDMSYEELLALGEQIGNVSTGLSEDKISSLMKERKAHEAMAMLEPCCVCQEKYVGGDNIGVLDCGHEFHTGCIKQWLMVKNLCPICKTTAFGS